MNRRERRTLLIFWLTVALLLLAAFATEAEYRSRVCISAMTVDASGTTIYPKVCT